MLLTIGVGAPSTGILISLYGSSKPPCPVTPLDFEVRNLRYPGFGRKLGSFEGGSSKPPLDFAGFGQVGGFTGPIESDVALKTENERSYSK